MLTTTSWLSLFQTNNLLSMTSIELTVVWHHHYYYPNFDPLNNCTGRRPPAASRGGPGSGGCARCEALGSIKKVFECRIRARSDRYEKEIPFLFHWKWFIPRTQNMKALAMNIVPVLISLGADGLRRTDVSLSNVFHEMTVTFFEWYRIIIFYLLDALVHNTLSTEVDRITQR